MRDPLLVAAIVLLCAICAIFFGLLFAPAYVGPIVGSIVCIAAVWLIFDAIRNL